MDDKDPGQRQIRARTATTKPGRVVSAILKQISNPHDPNSEIAVSTMKWLLCSKRPLKTKEFITAVTVHSEEQDTPLD